jgi:3'-phosphoadenosine 5'-phosphosulfate (PAPS) 3'-phosphatase
MSHAEQFYEAIALVANAFPSRTCLIVRSTHSLIYAAGSTEGYVNSISNTARQEHTHISSSEKAPQPGTMISHEDEFRL